MSWLSPLIHLVSALYIIHRCSYQCPLGMVAFISCACNSAHKLATQQDQKGSRWNEWEKRPSQGPAKGVSRSWAGRKRGVWPFPPWPPTPQEPPSGSPFLTAACSAFLHCFFPSVLQGGRWCTFPTPTPTTVVSPGTLLVLSLTDLLSPVVTSVKSPLIKLSYDPVRVFICFSLTSDWNMGRWYNREQCKGLHSGWRVLGEYKVYTKAKRTANTK